MKEHRATANKQYSDDSSKTFRKKVMIVSTKFRWYAESFANAFRECGCDVLLCKESIRVEKKDVVKYIKYRLHQINDSDYDRIRERINSKVLKKFVVFQPDIFLVVMGNQISPEALETINKQCKTVVVLTDTRVKYQYYDNVVPLYNKSYTYEIPDYEYYKAKNVNIDLMFGMVDESQYFPIEDSKKTIDLCFVGFMDDDRKALLERIFNDFPTLKMEFWGQYLTSHNPVKFLRWLCSKKRKVFKNRVIPYYKVNQIYNKTKICLNLNGVSNSNGWGSRLAEILGTRSFQIVKGNETIDSEFNNCLVSYHSYEELKSYLVKYLHDEKNRSAIASKGYERVTRYYTYRKAAQRILEDNK